MNLARRNPIPYYEALLADNDLVEVRHKTSRWRSYWFNDPDRLVSFFREHDATGDFYTSLNRPHPRIACNGATEQVPMNIHE